MNVKCGLRTNRHFQISVTQECEIKGGKPTIVQYPTPLHSKPTPRIPFAIIKIKADTICRLNYLASQLTPSTLTSTLSMSSSHSDEPPAQGVCDAAAAIHPQRNVTLPSPLDLGSPQPPHQPPPPPQEGQENEARQDGGIIPERNEEPSVVHWVCHFPRPLSSDEPHCTPRPASFLMARPSL
jgi:hypothetical protein